MIAQDILTKVRYSLSDVQVDRWSDDRLLSLLNDAIIDIAKNTTLFTETYIYTVANLLVDIDLSTTALKILRAEYLDEALPFYSFEEMDKKDKDWQLVTGSKVEAIIYDKQKNGLLKQYPIVSNAQNPHVEYPDGLLGITTDISYSDIEPVLADTIGDISGVPDEALIKFYYIRRHAKIDDVNDTLNIDELIEMPIKHYIVGMALRDNQDTQNRQIGNEEMQLYYNMVDEYSLQKVMDFVEADYTVEYRPND